MNYPQTIKVQDKAPSEGDYDTWNDWPDATGNRFRAGDRVAIATVSGKSPQLVIGTVLVINRRNSKGVEIVKSSYSWDREANTRTETETPACTVTVRPELDGRGFHRSKEKDGTVRRVTYHFPGNIVKLERRENDTEDF